MKFERHIVGEMEFFIQYCVICGKEICNYHGTMVPAGSQTPKGFPQGDVFISIGTNPRITTIIKPENAEIINCY